eukprot:6197448-Pleurochrysis_carterae.AAC.1
MSKLALSQVQVTGRTPRPELAAAPEAISIKHERSEPHERYAQHELMPHDSLHHPSPPFITAPLTVSETRGSRCELWLG